MKFVLLSFVIALAIVSASAQNCGTNEHFNACRPFPECDRSCYYPNPPGCEVPECDGNVGACLCNEGFVRNNLGFCVAHEHC